MSSCICSIGSRSRSFSGLAGIPFLPQNLALCAFNFQCRRVFGGRGLQKCPLGRQTRIRDFKSLPSMRLQTIENKAAKRRVPLCRAPLHQCPKAAAVIGTVAHQNRPGRSSVSSRPLPGYRSRSRKAVAANLESLQPFSTVVPENQFNFIIDEPAPTALALKLTDVFEFLEHSMLILHAPVRGIQRLLP